MANNERLIFPIGFDVESGVKGIEKDWPGYHKKLQKMMDKTPLKLKLKLDAKGLDLKSLRDYNKLTKEAALAAKRAADVESKRALARQRQSAARVAEATEEARIAKAKAQSEMAQLRLNDAQKNGVRGAERLNSAYSKQSTYLSRLVQRMGVYFGLHQVARMIRNIREITAEFELQRVSLGALIQDAHQANVLFGQIKAAAVESPYQIKELVNYTKQLAAYGIEQEKLFSTTMQYADVAAGLGADMSRIILAMGQIRAASVLKGTELRQLTELGIPMVQLLSDKLSELRGELVSTGEVFSMISDKAISFNMVQEIFDDLTGAGGRFYNMQQKQAETLAGQWSNLKDTIAIAYDEIGNTERVRGAMEGWIAMTKNLAENWKSVSNTIVGFAITLGVIKTLNRLLFVYTANTNSAAAAQARLTLAIKNMRLASEGGMFFKVLANQSLMAAKAMRKAALASNFFAKAFYKLKAALSGNWIMIVIAAIAALIVKLVNARQKANELKNELAKIETEGAVKMEQSVRNFERLAKIAVDSVDGTKRQTDALNELKRTYGDIIPSQDLQIDKLRAMNNEYDSLTQAIKEKIAMQTLEQEISTIQEDYGEKINKQRKEFRKYLEEVRGLSESESRAIVSNIEQQIVEGTFTGWYDALQKAAEEELMTKDAGKLVGYVGKQGESLFEFIDLVKGRESEIKRVTDEINNSGNALKKYADWWDEAGKAFQKATDTIDTTKIPKNTKLYDEEVEKRKVKSYADFLRKVFKEEKMDKITNEFISDESIDFKSLWSPDVTKYLSVQAKNAVRQVQDALAGMTGWQAHFAEFSRDLKIDDVDRKVFLYTDEEISNFSNLNDALEQTAKKYKELKEESERYGKALKGKINPDEKEQLTTKKQLVDEQKRQAYAILETYNALDLLEKKGGKDTDDWVTIWKNRAAVMKDFQQGVEDLTKKMGYANALAAQQDVMLKRGASVGIDLTTKKGTADELKEWYKEQIAKLTGEIRKMGAKEGFAELSVKAILKKDTKNQLIQEAQSLLQWLYNQLTDFETKTLEENLKKAIDELARNVARSKDAKDFYDKMLGMTGDRQLSADLTMSVYGGVGDDLKENIKRQLTEAFKGVDISSAFDGDKIDWSQLNNLVESIPIESKREEARKLVNEGIKDNARWLQDLYKTYEKFQTYEERRTAVMKREEELRKQIRENASLKPEEQEKQIAASRKREQAETLAIDIEEFKASKDWAKSFEEVENLATPTIERLMEKLKGFMDLNAAAFAENPEQLRTLMNEYQKLYDAIVERNPFTAISDGIKEYVEATQKLTSARQRLAEAAEGTQEYADAAEDLADAQDEQQKALAKTQKGFQAASSAVSNLGNLMTELIDIFGIAEDSEFGAFIQDLVKWLGVMATVLGLVASIIAIIEAELAPLLAVAAAIAAVGAAISWLSDAKVRKANEEIERQEEILKRLSRAYEKLEKAAESAFGTEYLDNYRERLELLQAEAEAYAKQIEAEQSKGKKADPDAIDDYEEARQETLDKLDETQKEIAERMLGTDLGSAARDFADAWLEAYKSFGNTSDAIGQKFSEMIDNMVAESVIAGVMKSALDPVFKMIDNMTKDDLYDPKFWQNLGTAVESATEDADVGATNAMKMLEAMGINIRDMGSNLSGISKDIATASEESILGLAAGINTQNFYISQIHAAVLRMEMLMQSGGTGVNIQDLVTIQNQHLAHLPNISANTAGTLQRCEEILAQVTDIATNLGRVIVPNGTSSSHQVRTTLS